MESSSSPGRDNAALARAGIELWNSRDWDAALMTIDPGIEWRPSGAVPGIDEVYFGHDGVLRFWHAWTGVEVDQPGLFQLRARDGLLTYLRAFWDREAGLAELGELDTRTSPPASG